MNAVAAPTWSSRQVTDLLEFKVYDRVCVHVYTCAYVCVCMFKCVCVFSFSISLSVCSVVEVQ